MWCMYIIVYLCMYIYIYYMYIIHVYTLWGWRAPLLTATWVFTRGPRFDLTHGFPRPCWPCPYWSLYASCDAHAHDQRRLDRWANDVRREGLWLILIEYYLDILIAFLKVFCFVSTSIFVICPDWLEEKEACWDETVWDVTLDGHGNQKSLNIPNYSHANSMN